MNLELFKIHELMNGNTDDKFIAFRLLCKNYIISPAHFLYENSIKYLTDDDDHLELIDIFVDICELTCKSANSIEYALFEWYLSILKNKKLFDDCNMDYDCIIQNILNSDNILFFNSLLKIKPFLEKIINLHISEIHMHKNNLFLNSVITLQNLPRENRKHISYHLSQLKLNKTSLDLLFFNLDHHNYGKHFIQNELKHTDFDELSFYTKDINSNYNDPIIVNYTDIVVFENLFFLNTINTIKLFIKKYHPPITLKCFSNAFMNNSRLVNFVKNNLTIKIPDETFITSFVNACNSNKLSTLKFFKTQLTLISNCCELSRLYDICCKNNHYNVLKFLITSYHDYLFKLPNKNHYEAFLNAVVNCDIKIIRTLIHCFKTNILEHIKNDNNKYDNEDMFAIICTNNKHVTLKYIIKHLQIFDFKNASHVFNIVCQKNYIKIANMFVLHCPEIYSFQIENNKITTHKIINLLPLSHNISKISQIVTCCVCNDEDSNIITPCEHQFCYQCLNEWYNKHQTCPYCRQEFEECTKISL